MITWCIGENVLTKLKQKHQSPCNCRLVAAGDAARARAWQLHLSVWTAGEIYERKCSGCKRPQRGMKSKTLLKTPRSRERCKTHERRRKARGKNFILGDLWVYKWSLRPGCARDCSSTETELTSLWRILFLWIQLGHFTQISSLIFYFFLCRRLQTWWIIPPLWQKKGRTQWI